MGTTIHFKIKYHGLNFSSDSLDYFKNISTDNINVTLSDDCKKSLPPYIEFTSKDFTSLQRYLDAKKLDNLSDIRVLYTRDLTTKQSTWNSYQVNIKISTKSFEDAEKNTFSALSSGQTLGSGLGYSIGLAPTDSHDISLPDNTDVYVILVIDSDPQSDSWYYPNIFYCDDDFFNADTKIFRDFSDGTNNSVTGARWCTIGFKGGYYPEPNKPNIKVGMTDNSVKEVYINNFDTKQGKYISCTKYTTPFVLPSGYTDYPNIKHVLSFKKLFDGEPSKPVTNYPNAGKSFLRIMYDKNTLNKPLLGQGFNKDNVWSNSIYNFISGPIYDLTNLKGFQDKSRLLMFQPSNTFDSSDKYDMPRISSYYHVDNDNGVVDESSFYGGGNFKGYDNDDPTNDIAHNTGNFLNLSNQYLDLNYMSTYNTVVVGNEHAAATPPTKDQLSFYPYLTFNLPNEALPNYDYKITNADSSARVEDSFHNLGLISGRKYTIEITNNNKKDYTTNSIYFVNNTDGKYLKLTDDYTFTAEVSHQYIITSKKPLFDEYNVYNQPVNLDKKTKVIIDFLHDNETTVKLMSTDGGLKWATIATNPINYDATGGKGGQVHLATIPNPDSTKYVTIDDTIYTIYYFANGKPDDLDLNNYSLDYLNKNATTKYVTNPKSNGASYLDTGDPNKPFEPTFNQKSVELFSTPCAFTNYGYYLILPVELKEHYGVLVADDDTVLQKIYVNKVNKIDEKYRPKDKYTVIGYYDAPNNQVGVDLTEYYYYHNKDYGITSKGFIDPNRYDNFICLPFDAMTDDNIPGELPAFELRYTFLANPKKDLGGYYNPTTHKIDPITIEENTGAGVSSSGGSTSSGGPTSSGGSTGSSTGGSTGGSTGSSTGGSSTGGSTGGSSTGGSSTGSSTGGSSTGSSGQTGDNTPINSNNQIHLYSINQQNILDLSSKDLSYQTSLNGFANYDANNFINQVYILPFSLPANLKENVSNIVTGLFKLDTNTVAIKQDHYNLDLGSISIKPKYNNGFDYNVTKCNLHLPFTNLISLDINDILNKTINIKYKVSLLNADTTINILSDNNLIFTGKINIGTDLQLFSINSNNITGLLNSVLQNDVLVPYITITRNKPINNLVSYETNEHNQLNNYTGFVQTNNSSVSCGTQEEQQEIENLLNGGIYIK